MVPSGSVNVFYMVHSGSVEVTAAAVVCSQSIVKVFPGELKLLELWWCVQGQQKFLTWS